MVRKMALRFRWTTASLTISSDLAMKVALIVHDEAGYGDIYVP